ncbi:hypothetical protein [Desulfosporosinus sp. Sb-LF]|uniref:hypothetical protein n=1 Tax=Desulfosporosinus sp. Sb-LF TaxID=2560027 RepID=UPI00107F4485|nr:hypothetical protein [Desulfosporosinus sp. Sb-LF]TGE34614.1 hypothetical protein E4K68_02835 [Desulfosporosinus sp. Sb-LF]
MNNIQYDPELILNGFTEEVLKDLARKLKRKIKATKNENIQEILSPPRGKPEGKVKVWQEINRNLRKELEALSEETSMMFSSGNVPLKEQFKVGYMFTLSSDPQIKAIGEKLYCQAAESKDQEREEKEEAMAAIALDSMKAREEADEMLEAREEADETIEVKEEADKMLEAKEEADETIEDKEEADETIEAKEEADETIEAKEEADETIEAKEEADETIGAIEEANEMIEARQSNETLETGEMMQAREVKVIIDRAYEPSILRMPSGEKETQETEELHKRIRTLENKLRKANMDGLRVKGQLEKLKTDMVALKSQWIREKEEAGKYRNRVRELEEEREDKEKELELLSQKLEQKKPLAQQKVMEQSPRRELQKVKDEPCADIDLTIYQGRKALIFAERDNEIDSRLIALGIIPIWAMEIDWNRPRRRMSTCELVLYKMNDEKLKKIDEIRDIAKYWNIPCSELLNISGRTVHDQR